MLAWPRGKELNVHIIIKRGTIVMVGGDVNGGIMKLSREEVDPKDPALHKALFEVAVGAYGIASDPPVVARIRDGVRVVPTNEVNGREGLMKVAAFIAGYLDEYAPMGDWDHPEPWTDRISSTAETGIDPYTQDRVPPVA